MPTIPFACAVPPLPTGVSVVSQGVCALLYMAVEEVALRSLEYLADECPGVNRHSSPCSASLPEASEAGVGLEDEQQRQCKAAEAVRKLGIKFLQRGPPVLFGSDGLFINGTAGCGNENHSERIQKHTD